jgi:hypothetical protein
MVGGKMHACTWEYQFPVFKYWEVSRNVSVTWTTILNHLIGFKEVTTVYCEKYTEHTNTLCRKKLNNMVYSHKLQTGHKICLLSAPSDLLR